MLIGIIGAMDEEVEALKNEMQVESELIKARRHFYKGKLEGKDVVVVVSGVGKVHAASCTQVMIDEFNVDVIINVGVAGGVGRTVSPGDVVVGNSLVQYDYDISMFGHKKGQISGLEIYDFIPDLELVKKALKAKLSSSPKIIEGRIVTGDRFICDKETAEYLVDEFDALATEMEGASIAHVAYLNEKPFLVIRSMSDNASTGASVEFEKFAPIAVENSLEMLKHLLRNM